jgi:ketosteroid isomerase-like protein
MRRFVLAAFALTVLVACQPLDTALSNEDIAAVTNLSTAYTQAARAGDADGVAVLYAEDAIEMPGDAPARVGIAAIRGGYAPPGIPDLTVTVMELDGRDGLAYERGTWSSTLPVADTTVGMTGKYLVIARKQADGSWLRTNVIWNNDAPMPQPE